MTKTIAVLKGDGIGPEIVQEAVLVLQRVGERFSHDFSFREGLIGGAAIDERGVPLPEETIDLCKGADSVLLGAVGGPKWDHLEGEKRPEKGLLAIRKALGLFANIRPAILFPELESACPLRQEIRKNGIHFTVVRELTG